MSVRSESSLGISAVGTFLFLAVIVACLAGMTLVWRGAILDRMWTLSPHAYEALTPLGKTVGIPLLLLGVSLAVASLGWFKLRLWGWWLAVALIATQFFGNLVSGFMGNVVRGAVGFAQSLARCFSIFSAQRSELLSRAALPRVLADGFEESETRVTIK